MKDDIKRVNDIARKHNLDGLYSMIKGVVGKTCWKAILGYGGELRLHMGARIPYDSPKMAGKKKGAWAFGTSATPWILITPEGLIASDRENDGELEERVKVLENRKVTGFGLSLPNHVWLMTFSKRCYLLVLPANHGNRH